MMSQAQDNHSKMDLLFKSIDPKIKTIRILNDFGRDGRIVTRVINEDYFGNISTSVLG